MDLAFNAANGPYLLKSVGVFSTTASEGLQLDQGFYVQISYGVRCDPDLCGFCKCFCQ